MKTMRRAGLILVLLSALSIPRVVSAQTVLGGSWVLEGEAEAGFRLLPGEPSKSESAKFEEYRDLPANRPFLDHLDLRLFTIDQQLFFELGGSKWGQKDQEYSLGAGRLGLWEGSFEWNQIPHTFSTNARFLATEGSARRVRACPRPARPGEAQRGARSRTRSPSAGTRRRSSSS